MDRDIDSLIAWARRGAVEQVKQWLHSGVNTDERDVYGSTALIEAAKRGKTEILRTLLRYGADIEARGTNGITALMGSCYNAQPEASFLLLKAGALPNVQDEYGNTALHWVVGDDSQILVEERRALDMADERWRQDIQNDWRLAVHSERSVEVVKLLLKSGADVHICNDFVVCFGKLLFFFNGRTSPTMAEVATVLAGNKVYVVAGRNNFARAI